MKYKVKYDYHTHTVWSHGKGTIEENVRAAAAKGLTGAAISDHGPGHLFYGIGREKLAGMRREIERLRVVYPGMDIFLSVEANILTGGNGLDLSGSELGDYDFVTAGYHYGVRGARGAMNFLHNYCPVKLPGRSKLKTANTDMAVKAIYENPIRILTHPGDKGLFDIVEIAKACADRGTLLEINARHGRPNAEEIRLAAKTGVKFIVGSDAHSPESVGSCEKGIKRALEAGLDMDRIVNIEEC